MNIYKRKSPIGQLGLRFSELDDSLISITQLKNIRRYKSWQEQI
jgi:hypothetical protein